jgi:hypothetical protein
MRWGFFFVWWSLIGVIVCGFEQGISTKELSTLVAEPENNVNESKCKLATMLLILGQFFTQNDGQE